MEARFWLVCATGHWGYVTGTEITTLPILGAACPACGEPLKVASGGGATHARDFLDTPFVLTSVRFNKSSFDGAGPQFYALLEGADSNGEKVTVTCGAKNVIAQAWKLMDMGALPVSVELRQSAKA